MFFLEGRHVLLAYHSQLFQLANSARNQKAVYCWDTRALQHENCTAPPKLPHQGGTRSLKVFRHEVITFTSSFCRCLNSDHSLDFPSTFQKWCFMCVLYHIRDFLNNVFPLVFSNLHVVTSWSLLTLSLMLTRLFILDREERWLQPGDKSLLANTSRWGLYWSHTSTPQLTDERWWNRTVSPAGSVHRPRKRRQEAKFVSFILR